MTRTVGQESVALTEHTAATMALTIYVGSSLRPHDRSALDAVAADSPRQVDIRPPVRRRDLLELSTRGAEQDILILDGEFGQSLAVSISEIRAVLGRGVRIFGASSMGALRAVECRPLGMLGSGWVYEQYQSGAIESDADVALLYDPDDYSPVTIPLVNVRWLMDLKARTGVVDATAAAAAIDVASSIHFRDRRPSVLRRRWMQLLHADVSATLVEELTPKRLDSWDRKRADALDAVNMALLPLEREDAQRSTEEGSTPSEANGQVGGIGYGIS